jgi:hypothetical protein
VRAESKFAHAYANAPLTYRAEVGKKSGYIYEQCAARRLSVRYKGKGSYFIA